jgi:rhodanese-related sulfurtransferase
VARLLLERGFPSVKPVTGGFDAWVAAGFPTEPLTGEERAAGLLP